MYGTDAVPLTSLARRNIQPLELPLIHYRNRKTAWPMMAVTQECADSVKQDYRDHNRDVDCISIISHWQGERVEFAWSRKDYQHNLAFMGLSFGEYREAMGFDDNWTPIRA
jgi:hypothetical protein